MLDGIQVRQSPRRPSLDSENEFESLSLGGGGGGLPPECVAPSPAKTVLDNPRFPLTTTNNVGDPPPPTTTATIIPSTMDPPASAVKRPTAPGVSRFGFKPPPNTSLSPRRPGAGTAPERVYSGQDMSVITRAAASVLSPTRSSGSGTTGSDRSGCVRPAGSTRMATRTATTASSATGRAATAPVRSTRAATAAAAARGGPAGVGAGNVSGGRSTRRAGAGAGTGTGRTTTRSAAGAAAAAAARRMSTVSLPCVVAVRYLYT